MKFFVFPILFFVVVLALPSCVTVKPVEYLQHKKDTTILNATVFQEPRIQPGDLLSITVMSDNPSASALYNQGGGSIGLPASPTSGGGSSSTTSSSSGSGAAASGGYLVNEDSMITMPGIGLVKAGGLTKKELTDTLVQYFESKNLLTHPTCDVRFLNYRITVLGEVNHPGQFVIPGDKVNILEAVGLAGDLTIWAKRDNVTVLRDEEGKRVLGKVDLTSSNIFSSPYYYLKQNDIVMIDQRKRKVESSDQTTFRYISVATSVVAMLAILYNIFK